MKSRRLRGPASLLTALWFLLAPGLAAQEEAPSRPEPAPAPAPVEPRLGALYRYDIKVFARGAEGKLETEPLALHFPGREVPAPADEAWHRSQLDGMIEAELDFAAVLFAGRGAAGHGEDGLRALMAARTGIEELGGEPPLLALVIDTERLLAPGVDEAGRDLDPAHVAGRLDGVIRDFFAIVPPEARLRLDDFEVVFVGPSFGVPHARDVFESLDGRGSPATAGADRRKIFFVAERSRQARRPATYDADAALMGPRGDTVVRFLGPGYDDSQIPGRGNPLRHREDTRFFAWSFDRVLLAAPTLVVIDWNDFRARERASRLRGVREGLRRGDAPLQEAPRRSRRARSLAAGPPRLPRPGPPPRHRLVHALSRSERGRLRERRARRAARRGPPPGACPTAPSAFARSSTGRP
ncbi:MAG: hypothetical protein R3F20_04935 [Planctomycetota bacterium]